MIDLIKKIISLHKEAQAIRDNDKGFQEWKKAIENKERSKD